MAKSKKRAKKSAKKKVTRSKKSAPKRALKAAKKGAKKAASRGAQKKIRKAVAKSARRSSQKPLKKAVKKAAKRTSKTTQKSSKKKAAQSARKATRPARRVKPQQAVRTQDLMNEAVSEFAQIDATLSSSSLLEADDPQEQPAESQSESQAEDEMFDEESDPMPAVGEAAPVFEARDQDGMRRNLSDFQGKWVVLYFYPKDGTSGCTKQACGLRDIHPEFEKLDAIVLGVSVDSVESHGNFAQQHDLPFTLISDETHEIVRKYGVWQKKSYMGREYMGTLRTTFLINPDGRIARVYENVDPEGHAEEVYQDLQDLTERDAISTDF